MIHLGKPFAKITGAAVISRQKANDRPVDQRFLQKRTDIGLADPKIALRVQQKMLVTAAKRPVPGHERGRRGHDLHQPGSARAAPGARVEP